MSTRASLYVGGSLFAAAVALAGVGMWLPVGVLVAACTYVAGRWDRRRRITELRDQLEQARGQVWALTEERRFVWNIHLDGRSGDRLYPDNGGGYTSPAVQLDRNSNTTAERGVPAQVRADLLP